MAALEIDRFLKLYRRSLSKILQNFSLHPLFPHTPPSIYISFSSSSGGEKQARQANILLQMPVILSIIHLFPDSSLLEYKIVVRKLLIISTGALHGNIKVSYEDVGIQT